MTNYNAAPPDEQVKKLLEQNLAYAKQIYLMTKKVRNYMLWGRIMSMVSLLVFVILPIVAGIIYLPNLLKKGLGGIINPAGVLNSQGSGAVEGLLQNNNVNQQDLLKLIENQGGPINAYKNILDLYKSQ